MEKRLKLCEMHSFSTSSNSRHHTTLLNANARSGPHVHWHEHLDDDATENVKPHLQLHVFCGVVAFAASQEYVSVQGWMR